MADSRADHDRHDLELVATWAAGEATGADLERAERLLDACDLCVGLARDLRTITLGLQALPTAEAIGAGSPAPRDFRLTPEQAARLRRGMSSRPSGKWTDRLVAFVATFGRPVGASLATLGIVGLLVGSTTLGFGGGAASAPISGAASTAAPALPAASGTAENGLAGGEPMMTKGSDQTTAYGTSATQPARDSVSTLPGQSEATPPDGNPAAWLLAASIAAIVGGLALVVIATRRG